MYWEGVETRHGSAKNTGGRYSPTPRGIWDYSKHAKSTSITLSYVLAEVLFRNRRFVLLVSDTEAQAAMFLGQITQALDKAREQGARYAQGQINAGREEPEYGPLSGEWSGAPLPRDVLERLGASEASPEEQDDILSAWEDGYFSAWSE